jgi:hypothetical protein
MSSNAINEQDYDSPGYEFLRSHRNMMNLYYKLVALDYQTDFCPAYKCPPISKYYFSSAQANSFEQQYLFISLCAWLIRDKCQMNFELDLDDMGASMGVVFEALKLLHEDQALDQKLLIRLEQGYGPEVVYALSCLADRALELAQEHDPQLGSNPEVRFHNKQHDQTRPMNSITIGQPIAGGTLTTRSLGKYFIEDSSLILDYQPDDVASDKIAPSSGAGGQASSSSLSLLDVDAVSAEDWLQQVDKIAGQLEPQSCYKGLSAFEDWRESLKFVGESKRAIQSFLSKSKPIIKAIDTRIERQMQVLSGREKFLQTNLRTQLERFLEVWRAHSAQTQLNKQLVGSVNAKTDTFESHNTRLKLLANAIESRVHELNDGSKLKELESMISSLNGQSDELDVKVGLLMAAHLKNV